MFVFGYFSVVFGYFAVIFGYFAVVFADYAVLTASGLGSANSSYLFNWTVIDG